MKFSGRWRTGWYISATGGVARSTDWVSATTPMICALRCSMPVRTSWPMGSPVGKACLAIVSLMMIRAGLPSTSLVLKSRPRTTRTPSTSKAPGLTMCRRATGCWPIGGIDCPTTAKGAGPEPVRGGESLIAAAVTPGSWRTRSRRRL